MEKNKIIRKIAVCLLVVISFFVLNHYKITDIIILKISSYLKSNDIQAKDVIVSAIGAFFGMGASLLLEQLLISSKKKNSIRNIVAELISIRDGINSEIVELLSDDLKSTIVSKECEVVFDETQSNYKSIVHNIYDLAFVLYIPIWETFVQTGYILEFKNKKYFEELILTYTKIYKLQNMINAFYCNSIDEGKAVSLIIRECVELNELMINDKYQIKILLERKG